MVFRKNLFDNRSKRMYQGDAYLSFEPDRFNSKIIENLSKNQITPVEKVFTSISNMIETAYTRVYGKLP